ncbi:MAG: hypothetical protein COC19_08000 [SAR86 cluster bacterium]|uniref:DUF1456 domain-containing protein n=1 Tax=SAR86 cluster bacterium TaxID=2030880 RepID=A0A2A4MGU7_9GAMM|nr:MAG: hypothetical protein COC19_08000 [SAR86 cluster bacterium]
MTNNDCLRRIRYIFDFNDTKMMALFALADHTVSRAEISDWLKRDDDPDYQDCSDKMLATFLNGLISEKRGKKPGVQIEPESRLNNNIIFRKLKIALDIQSDEILLMLESNDLTLSKHELSAFFRRPTHKHYRECKDQVLRNFLKGLQLRFRGEDEKEAPFDWNDRKQP